MAAPGNPPVRHLWLLRHGKAASDPPWGGSDRERPLTARGRRDASALGARLAGEQPVLGLEGVPPPELAVCSAAVRTRQTADLVAEAMADRLPVEANPALYGADPDLFLRYVREIDEGVRSALFVGHNPTVVEVAWLLLPVPADSDDPTTDRAVLEAHGFPTCALAVLTLEVGAWEDVAHGCADLAGVFKPPY